MKYKVLSSEHYYVDKTAVLERELNRFPSLYLEGAAASGKTTAVQMLLARRPDVVPEVFWMDEEMLVPQLFVEKLQVIRTRMESANEGQSIWIILENVPKELPADVLEEIIRLIEELPGEDRVILLGREQLEEDLLALLWKRKLELLPQKVLLFTEEETEAFASWMGCPQAADEVYQLTGGWAGCVDMLLRFCTKYQETGAAGVHRLRNSHEVNQYIENEILSTLSPDEQKILSGASYRPWIKEGICKEIIGIDDAVNCLNGLEKKGILLYGPRKKRWKIAPLFRSEGNLSDVEKREFLLKLGDWYERHDYIEEALYCLNQSGDSAALKECVIAHYEKVPVNYISELNVTTWQGDSWQLCYLRGVHYYLTREFAEFKKEMRQAGKGKEAASKEVWLNLAYLDPELSLEDWLQSLENYVNEYGPARLYHTIGESSSFLCGIRDLSGLFVGSRQEVKKKEEIWKNGLSENRWKVYELAKTEFYLEVGHKDIIKEDILDLILEVNELEERNIYQARISLMGNMLQIYQEERIEKEIESLKSVLALDWDWYHGEGIETLLRIQSLWFGGKENLDWWRQEMKKPIGENLNEENKMAWWYRAKACLYLNRYEKAEEIMRKMIPYFRDYGRAPFLAESLFIMAVLKWRKGEKGRSLRYVIESFLITGEYRFVSFYTKYGKAGKEVLEYYAAWLRDNEPEKWNKKKKYNYGDVLRMPFADYIQVILRSAKKKQKDYAETESSEELLTMMERIMLQSISLGMSNAEICEEQNLKLPTVKGHLYSLYKKLGVNSRVQAIRKAKELEILK